MIVNESKQQNFRQEFGVRLIFEFPEIEGWTVSNYPTELIGWPVDDGIDFEQYFEGIGADYGQIQSIGSAKRFGLCSCWCRQVGED